MKKSVKYAAAAGLLVLLCVVGVYGTFFAARNIGCAVDDSFSWKAYSYTPITSGTLYNYAFPSEEITLSAENREKIREAACGQQGNAPFFGQLDAIRYQYPYAVHRFGGNRERGSGLQALSVQGGGGRVPAIENRSARQRQMVQAERSDACGVSECPVSV